MFVCVARVSLQIPESGSLKAKRQVLRRITDRVKARFNVSVAEVDDNDLWQKAQLAMAVVGNDRRHVGEQMDKILQFVEDMYVAPVTGREVETLSFGEDLYGSSQLTEVPSLTIPSESRSLAEAEGLGSWEERHVPPPSPSAPRRSGGQKKRELNIEDARAVARALRNRRDWEKE